MLHEWKIWVRYITDVKIVDKKLMGEAPTHATSTLYVEVGLQVRLNSFWSRTRLVQTEPTLVGLGLDSQTWPISSLDRI